MRTVIAIVFILWLMLFIADPKERPREKGKGGAGENNDL